MIIIQEAPMAELKLISIVCHRTEDAGNDEIYILVNGIKVWGTIEMDTSPASKKSKDLTQVKPIPFNNRARVEVYDEDFGFFDDDDLLGTHFVDESEVGQGSREAEFTEDGAYYTLTYEVLASSVV